MKFKQYINEVKIVDILNNSIHTNCKQYLSVINGLPPIYRGMVRKRHSDQNWGIKYTKKYRRALGATKKNDIKKFNAWLEKNNHNRRDQFIVMGTFDIERARLFGATYMIFPIGDISYSWMDAYDFNIDDIETGWRYEAPGKFITYDPTYRKLFYNYVTTDMTFDTDPKLKMDKPIIEYFHTDEGLRTAYKEGYEIWINCGKYYFVIDNRLFEWDKQKQMFNLQP